MEGIFPDRGLQALNKLCLKCTLKTPQTANEMDPAGGKHDSNEDELGTESVHAVFGYKISSKRF